MLVLGERKLDANGPCRMNDHFEKVHGEELRRKNNKIIALLFWKVVFSPFYFYVLSAFDSMHM